jgi:hypothetical protein
MEKQIFIPIRWLEHNTWCCASSFEQFCRNPDSTFSRIDSDYYTILGIVNEILADKANCKEIVSLVFKVIDDNDLEGGYEITYLESEMIASKDDLESAFKEGEQWKQFRETGYPTDAIRFNDWFNEKF